MAEAGGERRTAGTGRRRRWATVLAVVCLAIAAGAVPRPLVAGAKDTPIYNAPAGGGNVTLVEMKYGPFTLDPQGGAHDQDEGSNLVPRPMGGYGLKSAQFDLVDENDQPIGRHDVHLHHFVIASVNHDDTACPDRTVFGLKVQPLIGSGMERTPIAFADPYALQVKAGDAWGAQWHFMNMSNQTRTFWVKYTLGIQWGANADNTRWVTPYWADSNVCPAGTTWKVPGNGGPDSVETKTKTWTMPFDGYIVGIGGHLHDGGLSMITKHGDGSLVCENEASYAGGMLDRISGCLVHDSIAQGEQLSVTSRYDNSAPHNDVMGIAVLYLWAGDQGDPPTTTTTTTTPPVGGPNETTTTTTTAPGSSTTTTTTGGSTTTTTADVLGAAAAQPAAAVTVQPVLAG